MHMILDARCRRGMNEVRNVTDFLLDVVLHSKLHLRHLHVQEFYTAEPSGPGISGLALLAESHLNIHTWPERGVVQMCLQSCKDFDVQEVKAIVDRRFGLEETLAEHCVDRAIGAPT